MTKFAPTSPGLPASVGGSDGGLAPAAYLLVHLACDILRLPTKVRGVTAKFREKYEPDQRFPVLTRRKLAPNDPEVAGFGEMGKFGPGDIDNMLSIVFSVLKCFKNIILGKKHLRMPTQQLSTT